MTELLQIPATPLGIVIAAAIGVLALSTLVCLARAARGPAFGDRLAALALATMNAVGVLALLAATRSDWRYLDIALVLAVLTGALPIVVGRLPGRPAARPAPEEKGANHVVAD